MIRWLEEARLSPTEKSNMTQFQATSFAKDLDAETTEWRLMSWPRAEDTPLRFLLRSSDSRRATFTIDDGYEYGKVERGDTGSATNLTP